MNDTRPRVTIYTDGGASPNPGPGGWGAILIHDSTRATREFHGGEPDTTNNRMELTAAIQALEALKGPCVASFFTDSEYLRRGITEWLPRWVKNRWKRRAGQEIQNEDLWRRLAFLIEQHEIHWEWVRGHAGNRFNERADQLASQAIREQRAGTHTHQEAEAEIYLGVSARDGEGTWAALIRFEEEEEIISGRESGVTSNYLDVVAAAEALSLLPERITVHAYSYSDYLRNGATQWLPAWRRRNWMTKDGNPVKNKEAWQVLDEELRVRHVEWPNLQDEAFPPSEFEELAEAIREAERGPDETFNWE